MKNVLGGICICEQCSESIIIFHVLNGPLKTLCPHCYGKEGNTQHCDYCNLPILEQQNDY